ncbi:MAG: SMP-30/gluconolactonase/LRE family protein, partial [Jatrophihabitans sp.]
MGTVRTYQAVPVTDVSCELCEGPRWDGERGEFLWVDIIHDTFRRAAWDGSRLSVIATYPTAGPVGAVASVAGGGWLAAVGTGFTAVAPDGTATAVATTPDPGLPSRMNDAECDPSGRFWAGVMPYDTTQRGTGGLYRLDPDGSVHVAVAHATIPNGLAWSEDGTRMWWVDSGDATVWTFAVAADGTLAGRSAFYVHRGAGVPDGICRDLDGQLWVAINGGGEVRRFAADGSQSAVVTFPDATQ